MRAAVGARMARDGLGDLAAVEGLARGRRSAAARAASGNAEGDDRDREDAEVLALDVDFQVVEQARHPAREVRGRRRRARRWPPRSHGARPRARRPRRRTRPSSRMRPEDARPPRAARAARGAPTRPVSSAIAAGRVSGAQRLPDVAGLVDEGGVLVHQLGDRRDALGSRSTRTSQPTRSQPRRGRWLPSWLSSRLR